MTTLELPGRGFLPLRAPVLIPDDPRTTRALTGDGTELLRAPGLLRVDRVRVGAIELPEKLAFDAPLDPQGAQMVCIVEDAVMLTHGSDGVPLLLRNVRSNCGCWNLGAPILITGEWDEAASPPPESLPPPPAAPVPLVVQGGSPASEDAPPARGQGGRFQKKT